MAWQLNANFFLAARGLLLASPLCHERYTSGGRSIQLLDSQLEGLKHDHEPDRFLVTTNWMALIFRPWILQKCSFCFEVHVETKEEKGKVRDAPFDVDISFVVVVFKNP